MTNDEKIEMIERQLVEVLAKLAECEQGKADIRAALEGARVLIAALTEAGEQR